jgi:hypothetical protein
MSYLPVKLGTIEKTINNGVGPVDSVTGLLLEDISDMVEQYKGTESPDSDIGITMRSLINSIVENFNDGGNNRGESNIC